MPVGTWRTARRLARVITLWSHRCRSIRMRCLENYVRRGGVRSQEQLTDEAEATPNEEDLAS
jgi:hypothetical protein